MFCYEMHLHCCEVSKCGVSKAEEYVKKYAELGFAGVVFTDHFIHGNTTISRSLEWKERMFAYFSPYVEAKKLGEKLGIDVIICFEHAYGNGKEVLVYGDITPEVLAAHPEIEKMGIKEFVDFCHNNGWFVAQAHPYRQRCYIDMSIPPIPDLVDGIEVYNHFNTADENIKATELCEKNSLIAISGSDTHNVAVCGNAGVAFDKRVANGKELAKALFKNKFKLIINGEIV